MPEGMLLRSRWQASHIASPGHDLTLDQFHTERELDRPSPIPLLRFIEYGRWFQERAVPQLERRRVERVSPTGQSFTVELEGGETFPAARVVVAGGIVPFAWRPPEFEALPRSLASHTADQPSLAEFAGRRVVVVGAGQSALEFGRSPCRPRRRGTAPRSWPADHLARRGPRSRSSSSADVCAGAHRDRWPDIGLACRPARALQVFAPVTERPIGKALHTASGRCELAARAVGRRRCHARS